MDRADVVVSALEFLPRRKSLKSLRDASQGCRGCPLYRSATQAVFGEGRKTARVMLVGEQPGDAEDRSVRRRQTSEGRARELELPTEDLKMVATLL